MKLRIRKRYIMLFASVAALAVGGHAFAGHISNTSTLSGSKTCRSNTTCNPPTVQLPKTTRVPVSLFVHTGTTYAHPTQATLGGKAKTVTLLFDDDGAINFNTTGPNGGPIPKCTPAVQSARGQVHSAWDAGTTIKEAWTDCGPGAPAANNAYLSPPGAVSGRASTSPLANFGACTLIFRGPDINGNQTIIPFARATTSPNSHPSCTNMANNTEGNTTVLLVGTITNAGVADFGKKLRVPDIDLSPLPLDDFTAKVQRGSVFTSRCADANKILNLRGIFQYTGSQTEQPPDTVNKTQQCLVG